MEGCWVDKLEGWRWVEMVESTVCVRVWRIEYR